MIKFKTTKKAIPNARTQEEHFIIMEILEVKYFPGTRYEAKAQYSYGDIKERPVELIFTKPEVVYLETAVGGLAGDNFNEKFDDLIRKATLYKLGNEATYGLTMNDWEVYIEEETIEEI